MFFSEIYFVHNDATLDMYGPTSTTSTIDPVSTLNIIISWTVWILRESELSARCCLHPWGLSAMPRSAHQKFVPHFLFPILTPRSRSSSSLSTQSPISYPVSSGNKRRTMLFAPLHGDLLLRIYISVIFVLHLAILSSPLTSHHSYPTWLISDCGHPSRFPSEHVFFNTLLPGEKISVLPTILPPSATYPRTRIFIPLYTLPLNTHKI
jgi:hypothetical protein